MTSAIPSDGIQHNEYATMKSEPHTRNQYLLRNVLVATLGEALAQKFGYAESLSASQAFNSITKQIDDFTGFQSWLPQVNGEEVQTKISPEAPVNAPAAEEASAAPEAVEAPAPTEAPAGPVEIPASDASWTDSIPGWASIFSSESGGAVDTANKTASAWRDYLPSFPSVELPSFVSSTWESVSGYVSDNGDWIALTVVTVAATSTANYMLRNKLKNPYLRNVISTLTGSAVVWGGLCATSYLGYSNSIEFKHAVDVGTRTMGYIASLNYGRQAVNFASCKLEPVTDWVTKPYSFETKKRKTD